LNLIRISKKRLYKNSPDVPIEHKKLLDERLKKIENGNFVNFEP
jgi:hypothetical protein